MTVKELSKLYWLNREIEMDMRRIEELYAKATGTTQKITGLPRSFGGVDKVGRYAGEIADLRLSIEQKTQKCFEEFRRLNAYISNVDDPQMRMILSLRFVNGMTWQQVAESTGGGNTEDGVRQRVYRQLRNKK